MVLAVFIFTLGTVCVSRAATQEEAKAMVDKAIGYWKANGKDKAIAEFNNSKGQFVKGDLYAFANSLAGVVLANGGNQTLVGQNHVV